MAQYTDFAVSVVNNSIIVTGAPGTKFLTNCTPGNGFKIKGSPVVYTVASVVSDEVFHLSAPYQGATASAQAYQIARDYTPNFGLVEISTGDLDWPEHLTQGVIRKLDSILASGEGFINGNNMVFTDTATGVRYFLRFTNGQLYRVEV